MSEIKCTFCQDFEDTNRVNLREIRECALIGIRRRYRYRVQLIEEQQNYGKSWISTSNFGHKPIPFFYCPVCGKKLK